MNERAFNLSFFVEGKPVAKARPRFNRNSGNVFTPKKTTDFENKIIVAAAKKYFQAPMIDTPLTVHVCCYIKVPKSWSKKDKQKALDGLLKPLSRPDIDNYLKGVLDALNGVIYKDDSQVVYASVLKRYSDKEGVSVVITS